MAQNLSLLSGKLKTNKPFPSFPFTLLMPVPLLGFPGILQEFRDSMSSLELSLALEMEEQRSSTVES